MSSEEAQKVQQPLEDERKTEKKREVIDGEREYKQVYNRMKRRPYRPLERGPVYDDYSNYRRYPEERNQMLEMNHSMRRYRSYPSNMYTDTRYPPHRKDHRDLSRYNGYDMHYRRRYDSSYAPYYNDYRSRPYYKKRVQPIEQTPVNILSVFGLGMKAKEKDLVLWLTEMLGEAVQFIKVDMILDKYTGFSKGYAFIYFANVEDATKAKDILSGQTFNNLAVRVEYSITQAGYKKEDASESPITEVNSSALEPASEQEKTE